MSEPSYPLTLDVAGRRVLVVGGGPVAARRAAALVTAGAQVVVVAPYVCEDLHDLVADGSVTWVPRDYAGGDLDGAWLVHTATGDAATDDLVAAHAEGARVWCVRAGDAGLSAAWTPAVARSGTVTVAVTAGGDPRRAKALRGAIAAALDCGDLPLRHHRPAGRGRVALVGGGPGDPGLVTTRGRRLVAEADVVVVDRLAPRSLLEGLDEDVEVIDVGKTPGHHPIPQEQINALLVERARAGHRVVRLKGGDPFVLGRGGEEALACAAAGVDVEVVPGGHPGHAPGQVAAGHGGLRARRPGLGDAGTPRRHPGAAHGGQRAGADGRRARRARQVPGHAGRGRRVRLLTAAAHHRGHARDHRRPGARARRRAAGGRRRR
jgi:uroporphyrin-III C-methyltransferase/precorrin-2 dehydrogenase/sirohydrochlorin ferrochelatase